MPWKQKYSRHWPDSSRALTGFTFELMVQKYASHIPNIFIWQHKTQSFDIDSCTTTIFSALLSNLLYTPRMYSWLYNTASHCDWWNITCTDEKMGIFIGIFPKHWRMFILYVFDIFLLSVQHSAVLDKLKDLELKTRAMLMINK